MKKMIIAAAIVCAAAFAPAATVGWTGAGMNSYAGDAYKFFVIGQNGADISTVTTALNEGKSVDSLQFGSGVVLSNGAINMTPAASGKTLDAGSYTAFYVLFDAAAPASGKNKYVLISGQSGLTKEVSDTTASVTFGAANVSSVVNNADNWKSFGEAAPGPGPDPIDTPEPTSGLLLLVGGAMLALRRKQK